VRIFGAYQHFNWEEHNLTPALQSFGDLVRYDWHPPYDQYDPGWHYGLKGAMNREMLNRVATAHEERPLDVFYGYLCGRLVYRGYIEALRVLGIPSLNMTLDDKTHRYSALEPTGWAGMVDIISAFDLCWTSDPTALDWYAEHGARAIYLPAGANPDVFWPAECERDIDVLFIGKNYGRRAQIVQALTDAGIDVACYGRGWPRGEVTTAQMVDLMHRAKITLGIGEAADGVLSLKGRDFEAPMAGAFYLAQDNPELEEHYCIGTEIRVWFNVPDLIDKCRFYLAHAGEAEAIRHNGAARARRDHTWQARFAAAFGAMGL
jgi:spore maturation protein CgeB